MCKLLYECMYHFSLVIHGVALHFCFALRCNLVQTHSIDWCADVHNETAALHLHLNQAKHFVVTPRDTITLDTGGNDSGSCPHRNIRSHGRFLFCAVKDTAAEQNRAWCCVRILFKGTVSSTEANCRAHIGMFRVQAGPSISQKQKMVFLSVDVLFQVFVYINLLESHKSLWE